jgi:hypothetical protein
LTGVKRTIPAIAGIIGPALFVTSFTVFGFFHQDYDAVSMYVSALSLGPSGWIQAANFMVFGLLSGLFAALVASIFSSGRASRAGPIILSLSALCFFLSGPFVMDPMGTAQTAASLHGTVHGILGAVALQESIVPDRVRPLVRPHPTFGDSPLHDLAVRVCSGRIPAPLNDAGAAELRNPRRASAYHAGVVDDAIRHSGQQNKVVQAVVGEPLGFLGDSLARPDLGECQSYVDGL